MAVNHGSFGRRFDLAKRTSVLRSRATGLKAGRFPAGRFAAQRRLIGMTQWVLRSRVTKLAPAAAAHLLTWPCAAALLSMVALGFCYRLLAERARRKTLVELVTRAPYGTEVIMESGPGGPAVSVSIGDKPRQLPPSEASRG